MKALKAFIKPFEAPQRSVEIKILSSFLYWYNFLKCKGRERSSSLKSILFVFLYHFYMRERWRIFALWNIFQGRHDWGFFIFVWRNVNTSEHTSLMQLSGVVLHNYDDFPILRSSGHLRSSCSGKSWELIGEHPQWSTIFVKLRTINIKLNENYPLLRVFF